MSAVASATTGRPKLSPRKRAQRSRMIQYVVLVALVLLAAFTMNWPQIIHTFFRPELIVQTVTSGLGFALLNTLAYTAGAFVFGLLLGTILALMKLSSVGPYRWLATAYIEFFRGVPAIIVFIAFSLLPLAFPGLNIPFQPYGTVWLSLGLVSGAYMAETIRAGIQAVPKGQLEAARSLGMPTGMATRKIILPQAFRIITPPLTNELILVTKDSSLVYVIGLASDAFDLTKYGRDVSNATASLTPLVVAGFSYLIITLPLSSLVRRMEANARKAR